MLAFLNDCKAEYEKVSPSLELNIILSYVSGLCSTTEVRKANGDCACGFYIWSVLSCKNAFDACGANGGRLAEIYSSQENDDVWSFMVGLINPKRKYFIS